MKSNLPKVSIITAAYNAEEYIAETIESVLNQSYNNWEMIIVDDGSTDRTKESVVAFLKDKRIKYFYQKNQKQLIARNNAFKLTKGEYIAILDADDVWMPTKLDKQLKLISKNPSMGIVYTGVQKINKNGKNIYTKPTKDITGNPLKYQIVSNNMAFSSFLIKKEAIFPDFLYRYFPNTCDEYLTIKLALDGWHFGFVNEKLLKYRIHNQAISKSVKYIETAFNEKIKIIDDILFHIKNKDNYKSILSIARARANLWISVNYIRYGNSSFRKNAREHILKSLNYSMNWSILLRAIKWYLLSFR